MRILLWHGYLLAGSGSNLYTANLARIYRAQGHDVLLLCQERRAREFGFVDADGDFSPDNTSYRLEPTGHPPARGRLAVARPDIGGLLPVYVYDDYEGFEVRRFVDLTDAELERYTSANIRAMSCAIARFRPEVVITGHEVMGPYIAREACRRSGIPYIAKLHGSALEYAVKQQERYVRFAAEGLSDAAAVVGGSRYMVSEAARVVPGWEERAHVVNPGCDVELFRPVRRDPGRTVGYVGKFIVSKGVHNLLAALCLTSTEGLRAVVVGFGELELPLRELAAALRSGDLEQVEAIAARGDGTQPLEDLLEALDRGLLDEAALRRAARIEVTFPGRLDHADLVGVLPHFDVLVVPSVLSEAFGMVAVEAAACGVLPVVPAHSGIGEVGAALEEALGEPGLLTYDPSDPLPGIAARVDALLSLPAARRADMGAHVAALARQRWSWEQVARRLLEIAAATRQPAPEGGPR